MELATVRVRDRVKNIECRVNVEGIDLQRYELLEPLPQAPKPEPQPDGLVRLDTGLDGTTENPVMTRAQRKSELQGMTAAAVAEVVASYGLPAAKKSEGIAAILDVEHPEG